jgi:hypothetical protein
MTSLQRRVLVSVALGALLVGCSGDGDDKSKRAQVHPVSGKITFQGSPVADASVSFAPATPEDKQPAAFARTNAEGIYKLTTYESGDGAAVGNYTVLVVKSAPPPAAPLTGHSSANNKSYDASTMHSATKPEGDKGTLLPEKYSLATQSDLKCQVKAGPNESNFDLKP